MATNLVNSGFTPNVGGTGCCFVAYSSYWFNEFSAASCTDINGKCRIPPN